MMLYTVRIYRRDSETVVLYERVKHTWWSNRGSILVVSQLRNIGQDEHDYWEWPKRTD